MNKLPAQYTLVPPEQLKRAVALLAGRSGIPEEKSLFLADLLRPKRSARRLQPWIETDCRLRAIMRDGLINRNPELKVIDETRIPAVDGDGGLGYFPAYRAAELLVDEDAGLRKRRRGHP